MEGILGYRCYEVRNIEVAFPFGSDLSYSLRDFTVTDTAASFTISNIGEHSGAKMVILYISRSSSSSLEIQRPQRGLRDSRRYTWRREKESSSRYLLTDTRPHRGTGEQSAGSTKRLYGT